MTRIRTTLVGLSALSLLLVAAPVAADSTSTESTDLFASEAQADGVRISVAGSDLLELSGTAAAATVDEAAATAWPAVIGDSAVGERTATSEGATVRDPEDADDVCQIAVPAPVSAVLDLGLLCGEAEATGDVPEAWAVASVGEVGVLSLDEAAVAQLADLLAALDLEDLLEQLSAAVGDDLAGDVFDGLRDACTDALEELDSSLLDPILDLLDTTIEEIAGAAPEELAGLLDDLAAELDDVGASLPASCEALLDLVGLGGDGLPGIGDLGALTAALLDEGEALLDVQLLGTASETGVDGDVVDAWAGADTADAAVGLSLSLAGLGDAITGLVEDALGDLLGTLEGVVAGTPLAGELPALDDLVDEVLGGSALLTGLLDDDLLDVALVSGEAEVVLDLDGEELQGDASAALVELGGPLLELSEALDELVGTVDSELLAALRDSPLADVLSVELVAESVDEDEVGGLPGLRATSGAASVTLLGAAEGGVDVEVASATAAVGHDTVDAVVPAGPDADPADPLPVTGGAALLLGLLALGGATALRRRD